MTNLKLSKFLPVRGAAADRAGAALRDRRRAGAVPAEASVPGRLDARAVRTDGVPRAAGGAGAEAAGA